MPAHSTCTMFRTDSTVILNDHNCLSPTTFGLTWDLSWAPDARTFVTLQQGCYQKWLCGNMAWSASLCGLK